MRIVWSYYWYFVLRLLFLLFNQTFYSNFFTIKSNLIKISENLMISGQWILKAWLVWVVLKESSRVCMSFPMDWIGLEDVWKEQPIYQSINGWKGNPFANIWIYLFRICDHCLLSSINSTIVDPFLWWATNTEMTTKCIWLFRHTMVYEPLFPVKNNRDYNRLWICWTDAFKSKIK